jgi:hypothetical protein
MIDPYDPVRLATAYAAGGAAAISVLTDENFFGGHLQHLAAVRKAVNLPILRKDFIVSEYQIYEARAHGADSFLLLSGPLSAKELSASIRTPELSTILRTLATQTIPHLAAAKRALEINAIPWPEILDHTHELPTNFEESPFGDFVKRFVTDLRGELLSRADEFATETESLLSSSFDEGDSDAFCVAASKALAHAAKSNYPENSKTKLLVMVDAWTLKFVNLAHAAVEHDLHLQEATLRSNPTSQRTIASGIETLSFFVDAMAPLRELLLSNRSVIPAARLNHFQSTALKTIHMAPIISSSFVKSLRDELIRGNANQRAIQHARFFVALPNVGSRLPEQAKSDLTAIVKLLQNL